MRRLFLLSLPLAVISVLPASAAPVATARLAVAHFSIPTNGDAELRVELRAVAAEAGDVMRVAVSRCDGDDCGFPRFYEGPLPAGALTVSTDAASGRLQAVVGGLPLKVAWTPVAGYPALTVGGVTYGGRGDDSAVSTYRADPARVALQLPVGNCTGQGAVGDEVYASAGSGRNGAAAPLSRLRLQAQGAPACAT